MSVVNVLVSVIIPCYNNAKLIRKCVKSVLAQTYHQFEILIIDDGSEDNISAELVDIEDSRLKKIIRIQHSGVSAARNVGIIAANGEYIIFVDGDDWIEPNHIEILLTGLEKAEMAMIEMITDYQDKSVINSQTNSLFVNNRTLGFEKYNLLFESYLLSSPCNKIYRTEFIKGKSCLYFERGVSYAEDLLFNLEYFRQIHSVALMPFATYHYVKQPISGTTRYHSNTNYTIRCIVKAARQLFNSFTIQTDRMLLELMLWGLHNIHHPNTDLSSREQIAAVKDLLSIPELRSAKARALEYTAISFRYRFLLLIGSSWLIHKAIDYISKD